MYVCICDNEIWINLKRQVMDYQLFHVYERKLQDMVKQLRFENCTE